MVQEDDNTRRLRMRLTQVMAATVTVLAAGWVCTLGIFPAIVAISIAKHVLVAILMMGLGVDAPQEK
jgi:hypothetical protein